MLYRSTYKNWETTQFHICHYDLLSQTVRLKKAVSKWTFFYSMQHRTLYMKTCARFIVTGYINLPQKHCCSTLNSRQWSIVQQQTIVVFALQQWLSERPKMSLLVHCLSCSICSIPSMALQPLLDTTLPQKTLHSSLSSVRLLHPRIPSGTSSHLVLGFPTGLALSNFPLRTFYLGILSPSILIQRPSHPNFSISISSAIFIYFCKL
jgi:hypothetical protein